MENPFTDIVSPELRKALYLAAFMVALLIGLWQAAEGDWLKFVASVASALIPLLAASNTPTRAREGQHRGGH